ncbi:phosphocholine cytidylyltransferase family protein [Shewanella sp.]|uniref:phosphocholine cytidylyltransferase family protein n=1 Tax=Shewanella sp. TaxID=50422 RepID=UPI001EBE51EA|nr:phosphocholine cytidylyltransferase family protein [Shewanella sp.]NRB23292.1 phosphocholine cytidylyltransferase family protein [Shewanella sp.]
MKEQINNTKIKAIILAAGVGSRIRPLTDNCPKSLLKIGDHTILQMMVSNLQACGINDVIFVLGYLQDQIKDYVRSNFPSLNAQFVTNERYEQTNTGYSLMLTEPFVKDCDFIKFDADVVFDQDILRKLIVSDVANCLCIDKDINLDAEEIKVIVDEQNKVLKASKEVAPQDAIGESIGIEKISKATGKLLFTELKLMMNDPENHQAYYEAAYERLIEKNVTFNTLDITGLKWTEIDTQADFSLAKSIFCNQI